jgi:hypothetical protein
MSRIDPATLRANINAVLISRAVRSYEAQELGRRGKKLRTDKERGTIPGKGKK